MNQSRPDAGGKSSAESSQSANCPVDLDSSVVDWIMEYPHLGTFFEARHIDYCCGGKSLAFACRERGLDPESVYRELLKCR